MITYSKHERIFEKNELVDYINYLTKSEIELVLKAYDFAKKKHENQTRSSGAPFFVHPLEVMLKVAKIKMDCETLCVSLLHDVIEDTNTKITEIEKIFGEKIAHLILDVSKISTLKKEVEKLEFVSNNIRNILIAGAKDLRVLIIKLADRIHNLETIMFFKKKEKRERIAKETLEIYVPIAHKIGISEFKIALEDLTLKTLYPEIFEEVKQEVNLRKHERESTIREIVRNITTYLQDKQIKANVYGRAKHFYSIFKKITQEKKSIEQIYDLFAVRVIVNDLDTCYKVLGIIHSLYKPMPDRLKDYIANPKANGYQSLHTTVFGKNNYLFEVQIRTYEMHLYAEYGLAAHWRYKKLTIDKFDKRIEWLKDIIELKDEFPTSKDMLNALKIDVFKDQIVCFTPKGDPIELPEEATVLDFAFGIHSEVGLHAKYGKIDGLNVPLKTVLESGQIVEIITTPGLQVTEKWLTYVITNKAKTKIRSVLGIKSEEKKHYHDNPTSVKVSKFIDLDSDFRIAGCCKDLKYNDDIVLISNNIIHKKTCENINPISHKIKPVSWKQIKDIIIVDGNDRTHLFHDVIKNIKKLNLTIERVYIKKTKNGVKISIMVKKIFQEEITKKTLHLIKGVKNIFFYDETNYNLID